MSETKVDTAGVNCGLISDNFRIQNHLKMLIMYGRNAIRKITDDPVISNKINCLRIPGLLI